MIRNIRYRRDQRQLEEEEEMWFNEEDDFTDVVPTGKSDIDPYSKCTKARQQIVNYHKRKNIIDTDLSDVAFYFN